MEKLAMQYVDNWKTKKQLSLKAPAGQEKPGSGKNLGKEITKHFKFIPLPSKFTD